MITTVTGKNQISIPAALAHELGLKPGSRIDWSKATEPDQLICRVLPEPSTVAANLRGDGRRHLTPGKRHPLTALRAERNTDEFDRREIL